MKTNDPEIQAQLDYIDKLVESGETKNITQEFWEAEDKLRNTVYNPEAYLKLYIAVLDDVPDFMVPTLVAHSMLGAHLDWWTPAAMKEFSEGTWSEESYINWLNNSFRKCVIRVNQKEFDKISQLDKHVYLGHENTTLGGKKSCAIPYPVWSTEIPNVLKFAKLWKPKNV